MALSWDEGKVVFVLFPCGGCLKYLRVSTEGGNHLLETWSGVFAASPIEETTYEPLSKNSAPTQFPELPWLEVEWYTALV